MDGKAATDFTALPKLRPGWQNMCELPKPDESNNSEIHQLVSLATNLTEHFILDGKKRDYCKPYHKFCLAV